MHNEPEAKIRQRAHGTGEGEGRPDGPAERHRLKAEREAAEEAQNAAVSRWAAPVRGTYVEKRNEAARTARTAGKAR